MTYSRVRLWTVLLLIQLVIAGTTLPSIGAVKPGSVCKKINQVRVVDGSSLKCVKSGQKSVWRKVALAPRATPAVNVTPTPSSSPTPSATDVGTADPSSIPSNPSDSLSYKNVMIYGLRDSKIIRKADSGTFFESDSRESGSFSEIRQRAFAELNKNPDNRKHSNVEFDYEIRSSFPDFLIDFLKRELDQSAALWNEYFNQQITVKVYMVTEKDREYIKGNRWLQQNLVGTFDHFDDRSRRPFISGGAGFWNQNGNWSGNIYFSAASWTDLNFMNFEWPQIAQHEFVHVVQDYAFYRNLIERPREFHELVQPIHFREGGANAISYLTSFRNIGWSSDAMDWNFWSLLRDSKSWITIRSEADAIKVMRQMECLKTCAVLSTDQPEKAFWLAYPYGAVMYEWVLGTYGLDGFKRMLDQLVTASSFDQVTRGAFGLGKDEFYAKVAPYILEVIERTRPYDS